ncbi:retrovirus-related pol polyprotein from transposon 17.6 [Tanacetum coccineum]
MISQRVADALLDYEANRNSGNGSRNGNGNENNNGNGRHDPGSGNKRTLHTARGCTYKEFLNCQPLNCKGTKRAIGLAHWTVGHDVAYEMTWKSLMKMMTEAYCLRNEIQKLENELWNLTVKERFIGGLPDSIQGNVTSSKPTRLQEAIQIANSLMDQNIHVYVARQVDNKRRIERNPRNDHVQKPPYKRQNVARVYTARPGEKKEYAETLPLCNKYKYHHTGSCTAKCGNCKRIGHQTKDCRSLVVVTNQRSLVENQRTLTCFECGKQGHYHSECPKLKK